MDAPLNLKDLAVFESFPGLSIRFLRENLVFPLKQEDGHVLLAMAHPDDQEVAAAMEVALQAPVVPVPAAAAEILEVIQTVYEPGSPMARLVGDLESEELDVESEETSEIGHLRDMAREAPIIQLVNLLVLRAIQLGASDIHLEPFEDAFRVRYRKDGILYETESPPKGLQAAVLSRLKIMARLDIAERRLPQDGRFRLKVQGHDIDFRVSTLPTLMGESMVIRILDREKVILNLHGLGFPARELAQFDQLIHKPYGMILVTGPTGSGKMPATSLTPATPAMAPLTRATRSSVRSTLMPAKREPWGDSPTARRRRPVAVRLSTHQATTMTTMATMKPRCSRERPRKGRKVDSLGSSADSAMRGNSGKPVSGSVHGPWRRPSTTRRATGLSSSVVTTSSMPDAPAAARAGAPRRRRRGPRRRS